MKPIYHTWQFHSFALRPLQMMSLSYHYSLSFTCILYNFQWGNPNENEFFFPQSVSVTNQLNILSDMTKLL